MSEGQGEGCDPQKDEDTTEEEKGYELKWPDWPDTDPEEDVIDANHNKDINFDLDQLDSDGDEEDADFDDSFEDDDDDDDEKDPVTGLGDRPEIGDREEYERYFGYQYNIYLSGKRPWDQLCNLWHIAMLFLSLVLFMGGVLLRFYFGRILIIYVQALPTFGTYSSFVRYAEAKTSTINFSGYIQELGTKLIVLNTMYVSCVLGFMTYPLHRFGLALPAVSLTCAFIALIEMVIINIHFTPAISQDDTVIKGLQQRLSKEYKIQDGGEFSLSYDYMSIWLGCCGIVDQYDFQSANVSFTKRESATRSAQVAPTCCKKELFEIKGSRGRKRIMDCVESSKNINEEGCFTVLTKRLEAFCRVYSIAVWIHLLDCFLHAYLYKIRVSVLDRALRARFGVSTADNQQS